MTPDELRRSMDAAARRGIEPPLLIVPADVLGMVVRTVRGVEIPLFAEGWGPLAVHATLAEIERLPEVPPDSRRV